MLRALLAVCFLVLAPVANAVAAQALDGTWLLFSDPADPDLARLTAEGARLPQAEIDAHKRILFSGNEATVLIGESTVTMRLTLTATDWGYDAQVSALDGTEAPITFLRIELGADTGGTLTSYAGQQSLESFAIIRVQAEG